MKTIIAGIAAAIAIAVSADVAAAQVAPRWTYDGSAVCPEGHDYRRGACMPRGYGGYRQSYGRLSSELWRLSGELWTRDPRGSSAVECRRLGSMSEWLRLLPRALSIAVIDVGIMRPQRYYPRTPKSALPHRLLRRRRF